MRPTRNDLGLGHVGPRAVTGAERASREAEGNGRQAVDGQGDVTRSEGVVWGRCARPQRRALRPARPCAGC